MSSVSEMLRRARDLTPPPRPGPKINGRSLTPDEIKEHLRWIVGEIAEIRHGQHESQSTNLVVVSLLERMVEAQQDNAKRLASLEGLILKVSLGISAALALIMLKLVLGGGVSVG